MAAYRDITKLSEQIASFRKLMFSPRFDYMTGYSAALSVVEGMISELPEGDVTEVKHGHWHLLYNCANEGVYCSVCNKKVYKTDYANQKIKSPYCPNCGAKMDLKEGV